MQQFGTDMGFEEGDGAADGGGRATELAAGAGKTALVERGDKDLHRIDTVHHSSPDAAAGCRRTMPEALSRILPLGERVPLERRAFVHVPNERISL